ncbi:MAG: hypothetical protein WCA81_05790 [Rhizomicrobium sp.]
MAANFHEHFEEAVERPSDRSTGLVFAAASIFVAAIYYRHVTVVVVALALAVLFGGGSLLAPHLLRPLNIVWFNIGLQLSKIMGPVVMAVLFLLVIVPFGYIMQLRYDPLRARIRHNPKSYWIDRDGTSKDGAALSMRDQF